MRPINKGEVPQEDNTDKVVADYKDWRADLIDRIGSYCVYCDMPISFSPQVEHVIPKNPQIGQITGSLLGWDNVLLACGPCNRAKWNHPISTDTHYIPDFHNTSMVFDFYVIEYTDGTKACIPRPSNHELVDQTKSKNTIDLMKLDQVLPNPRATDMRWKKRYETLVAIKYWRQYWDDGHVPNEEAWIGLLTTSVRLSGFFNLWYNEFKDIPQIREAICLAQNGTSKNSFDGEYLQKVRVLENL